jgi:RNA polymerase sigma-70 factor (ECF subfamily)
VAYPLQFTSGMNAIEAPGSSNDGSNRNFTAATLTTPRFDLASAVRLHGESLFSLAIRLTGDRDAACDLLHDTYERAMRSDTSEVTEAKARSWLMVVMRNLHYDRWRWRQRHPEIPMSDEILGTLASEPAEAEAEARPCPISVEQVRRCLGRLTAPLRAVYELRAFGGKSYEEISTTLRVPSRTVGTRLLRARQKLQQALLQEMATAAA